MDKTELFTCTAFVAFILKSNVTKNQHRMKKGKRKWREKKKGEGKYTKTQLSEDPPSYFLIKSYLKGKPYHRGQRGHQAGTLVPKKERSTKLFTPKSIDKFLTWQPSCLLKPRPKPGMKRELFCLLFFYYLFVYLLVVCVCVCFVTWRSCRVF